MCLVADGQPGAEIRLGGDSRGESGIRTVLGSPSLIAELCVVGKNEMGTTENMIPGGKLQMANVCKAYVQPRFLSS